MVTTESTSYRRAAPLRLLPVALLLCVGCHQFDHRCTWLQRYPKIPPRHETDLAILNAGYCETQWIPLAPTCGPEGYIEHFADGGELQNIVSEVPVVSEAATEHAAGGHPPQPITQLSHTEPVILRRPESTKQAGDLEPAGDSRRAAERGEPTPGLQEYLR